MAKAVFKFGLLFAVVTVLTGYATTASAQTSDRGLENGNYAQVARFGKQAVKTLSVSRIDSRSISVRIVATQLGHDFERSLVVRESEHQTDCPVNFVGYAKTRKALCWVAIGDPGIFIEEDGKEARVFVIAKRSPGGELVVATVQQDKVGAGLTSLLAVSVLSLSKVPVTVETMDRASATSLIGQPLPTFIANMRSIGREGVSTGPIAGQTTAVANQAITSTTAATVVKTDSPGDISARLALVIGNAAYGANFGRLANPVNDANAVAMALRRSGFTVTVVTDSDQRAMKRAIAAFGQQLADAGKGATGLFYYAGHGVQSRGVNYLVPVNAAIDSEADVDIEAVAADGVLRQMEEAGAATSIVILDACRNLPIARTNRDGARGLARMEAPNGSFVAYSTAPGSTAADGSGANSPFATALVAEMSKPGQPIEAVFRNVRRNVLAATGGKQTPWDSSSLLDSFVFVP